MTILGWALVAFPIMVVAYTYVGYPAILWLVARGRRAQTASAPADWPMISIVVPAYNEERQIAGKIDALLNQDYPADRRQILVLSDASTDRTDEIVTGYADRGVELMRIPVRSGKTAAENASCARLTGQIIVNSDASVRMAPGALRLLVSAMTDPSVGVASTRDVSVLTHDVAGNDTEAGYVGYEMRIRALESATGGIVGASGSGYAIRRELHDIPIPQKLSRDFSAALTARKHGYRAVSVDDAICWVPRTNSLQREYKRKVRTIARGIDTLMYQRRLLNPIRHGAFAWKLWSHKVCRWLVPASALVGLIGVMLLALSYPWARVALLGVAVLAGLVALAWRWPPERTMPRVIAFAAFPVLANVAVLHAIVRLLVGSTDHVWEPTRRTDAPATALPRSIS